MLWSIIPTGTTFHNQRSHFLIPTAAAPTAIPFPASVLRHICSLSEVRCLNITTFQGGELHHGGVPLRLSRIPEPNSQSLIPLRCNTGPCSCPLNREFQLVICMSLCNISRKKLVSANHLSVKQYVTLLSIRSLCWLTSTDIFYCSTFTCRLIPYVLHRDLPITCFEIRVKCTPPGQYSAPKGAETLKTTL